MQPPINEITSEEAHKIIDKRTPRGLFYFFDKICYVGIDNRNGDAWTEEFETKQGCINWLLNIDEEDSMNLKGMDYLTFGRMEPHVGVYINPHMLEWANTIAEKIGDDYSWLVRTDNGLYYYLNAQMYIHDKCNDSIADNANALGITDEKIRTFFSYMNSQLSKLNFPYQIVTSFDAGFEGEHELGFFIPAGADPEKVVKWYNIYKDLHDKVWYDIFPPIPKKLSVEEAQKLMEEISVSKTGIKKIIEVLKPGYNNINRPCCITDYNNALSSDNLKINQKDISEKTRVFANNLMDEVLDFHKKRIEDNCKKLGIDNI